MIFLPLPVIDNLPTQKKKVKKNCLCLVRKTLKRKKKQIVVVKDREYKLIIMLFLFSSLRIATSIVKAIRHYSLFGRYLKSIKKFKAVCKFKVQRAFEGILCHPSPAYILDQSGN